MAPFLCFYIMHKAEGINFTVKWGNDFANKHEAICSFQVTTKQGINRFPILMYAITCSIENWLFWVEGKGKFNGLEGDIYFGRGDGNCLPKGKLLLMNEMAYWCWYWRFLIKGFVRFSLKKFELDFLNKNLDSKKMKWPRYLASSENLFYHFSENFVKFYTHSNTPRSHFHHSNSLLKSKPQTLSTNL